MKQKQVNIEHLPKIVDPTDGGYEQGVSAMFCGHIGNRIIVAGGCNFPEKPVYEGGAKRFYDGIYSISLGSNLSEWKRCASLPRPLAYGASVSCELGIMCIGGQDQNRSYSDVFLIYETDNGEIRTRDLANLPIPLDNMYATCLDNVVYVVGGNANGQPSASVFALDLSRVDAGWTEISVIPDGPRVQPVVAGLKGKLYIWGGFHDGGQQGVKIKKEGYAYTPKTGEWERVATPTIIEDGSEVEVFLGGGIGAAYDDHTIVCCGGVNKDIFEKALLGEYERVFYLTQPKEWYRFNQNLFGYDVISNVWTVICKCDELARAGAGMIVLSEGFVCVQGEEKPGIRSSLMSYISVF